MSGYFGGPAVGGGDRGGGSGRGNSNRGGFDMGNNHNVAPKGYGGPTPMHRESQQQQSLDKHYKEKPRQQNQGRGGGGSWGDNRGNNSNWGSSGRGGSSRGGGTMFDSSGNRTEGGRGRGDFRGSSGGRGNFGGGFRGGRGGERGGRGRGRGFGGPSFPISRGGLHRRKNNDDEAEEEDALFRPTNVSQGRKDWMSGKKERSCVAAQGALAKVHARKMLWRKQRELAGVSDPYFKPKPGMPGSEENPKVENPETDKFGFIQEFSEVQKNKLNAGEQDSMESSEAIALAQNPDTQASDWEKYMAKSDPNSVDFARNQGAEFGSDNFGSTDFGSAVAGPEIPDHLKNLPETEDPSRETVQKPTSIEIPKEITNVKTFTCEKDRKVFAKVQDPFAAVHKEDMTSKLQSEEEKARMLWKQKKERKMFEQHNEEHKTIDLTNKNEDNDDDDDDDAPMTAEEIREIQEITNKTNTKPDTAPKVPQKPVSNNSAYSFSTPEGFGVQPTREERLEEAKRLAEERGKTTGLVKVKLSEPSILRLKLHFRQKSNLYERWISQQARLRWYP